MLPGLWSGYIKACHNCARSLTPRDWETLTRVPEEDPPDGEARRCSCGALMRLRTEGLDAFIKAQREAFDATILGEDP